MRDHRPTPVSSIHRAVEIGYDVGLRYVYAGNVPGDRYEHTRCPACGAVAIERSGYRIRNNLVEGNKCPQCGEKLAIVAA
jgi:pyruvate formate lyase activating enzyme